MLLCSPNSPQTPSLQLTPQPPASSGAMSKRAPVSKPKGAVRAKSGCYTCRIRRKKCDEKPNTEGSCQTCVRLRIECLGFGSKRPDWMREGNSVTELRSKIKDFLAQNGMIKGHSAASYSRAQASSDTPTSSTANVPTSSMSNAQHRDSSSSASPPSIHYSELHSHDSNGISRATGDKPVLVLSHGHPQQPPSRVHSHGTARASSDLQRPYQSNTGSLASVHAFPYGRGTQQLESAHLHHPHSSSMNHNNGTYSQVPAASRRSSPPSLPHRRTVDLLGHASVSSLSSPSSSSQSSSNPSSSTFSTLPLSTLSPGSAYPHGTPLAASSPSHTFNGLPNFHGSHARPRGYEYERNYNRTYPDADDGSCFSGYPHGDSRGYNPLAMHMNRDAGREHPSYDDGYTLGLCLDLTADTSTPLSVNTELWPLDSNALGTSEPDERGKSERVDVLYDYHCKLTPSPTVHIHASDDANANPACDRPSDLGFDANYKRLGLHPPSQLHSHSPRSDAMFFGSANAGPRSYITGPTTAAMSTPMTSGMTSAAFNTVSDALTGYSYHPNNNADAGYAAITPSTQWPVGYVRANADHGVNGSAVAQSPSPYSMASQLTPDSPMHPARSSAVLGSSDVNFPSQAQAQEQGQVQLHASATPANGYQNRVSHGHILQGSAYSMHSAHHQKDGGGRMAGMNGN